LKISSYDAIEKRALLLKVMKASVQYKYYYNVVSVGAFEKYSEKKVL